MRYFTRICSHCGKEHIEGWYLSDFDRQRKDDAPYACSDECALAIYQAHGQGKEEFDYDIKYELSAWRETIH